MARRRSGTGSARARGFSAKSDRLAALERLAAREHDISNNWEQAQRRGFSRQSSPKAARRQHLQDIVREIFVQGGVRTLGRGHFVGGKYVERGDWGHQLPGLLIPDLLCVYPTVIACIVPYRTEAEFRQRHGVTVEQLARLAELGAVVIDLNSYLSDQRRKFKGYGAACPKIERLLELPQCCIHAIRLDAFLRAAARAEVDELAIGERARVLFSTALTAMSRRDWHTVYYDDDLSGALTATARRLLYVRSLCHGDALASRWLSQYEQLPDAPLASPDAIRWLRELQGIKQYLATPFTAAFGGHTQFRIADWDLFCELWGSSSRDLISRPDGRRATGDGIARAGWCAILAVLREFAEGRQRATNLRPVEITDEMAFENFISWIRDTDLRTKSLDLIDELHDELIAVYDPHVTAEILSTKLRSIANDKRYLPSASEVASTIALGAISAGVGAVAGNWNPDINSMAVGISTLFGGFVFLRAHLKGWITNKLMSARRVAIADTLAAFAGAQRRHHRRIY